MARARALIRPVRTSGALIVNPRPKRNPKGRATKRKAPRLLINRKRRSVKRKSSRRRARRNPLAIRTNRRHYGALAIRTKVNGRKRHRKASHKRHRRARKNPLMIRVKRNGKRRHAKRNPSFGGFKVKGKGIMASLTGFLAPAGFGALATEPLIMVADLMARYLPTVPTSLVYAGAGVLTGTGILMLPVGSADQRQKLAIAAASAGGAIGYFHWRTGQDGAIAGSMGSVRALGYSSPVDFLAGPSNYAGYGPEAVYPLDRELQYSMS
jgi:hypothetical protein